MFSFSAGEGKSGLASVRFLYKESKSKKKVFLYSFFFFFFFFGGGGGGGVERVRGGGAK